MGRCKKIECVANESLIHHMSLLISELRDVQKTMECSLKEIASSEDGYCRSRHYDVDCDGNQIEIYEEFDVVKFASETLAKIQGAKE